MSDGSCRVSDSFQFCGTNRISEPGALLRYHPMVAYFRNWSDNGRCGPVLGSWLFRVQAAILTHGLECRNGATDPPE